MVGTVCLQILLGVALSSVVNSRNGFECYKKIDSDEIKAETRWENVKLHGKGTSILRDASSAWLMESH